MSQIIRDIRDMTYLNWSVSRSSSGTAGSFLKAVEDTPQGRIYYKLSDYDPYHGIVGHESVNEIIADRLLDLLDIPHVSYSLIHADIRIDGSPCRTWLCASMDFRRRGEMKTALDAYYDAGRLPGESPLDFCIRKGWAEYVYQMLVVDFLILNRDRHGANMEVLVNRTRKTVRPAPLFDHGVSLFCRCRTEEELEKQDVLADRPVQSFVGSRSALENLRLIPPNAVLHMRPLREEDIPKLTEGLEDALGNRWLERIREMIYRRWQVYEDLRNQR